MAAAAAEAGVRDYDDGYGSKDAYVASRRGVWRVARWQLLLAIIAPLGAAVVILWGMQ